MFPVLFVAILLCGLLLFFFCMFDILLTCSLVGTLSVLYFPSPLLLYHRLSFPLRSIFQRFPIILFRIIVGRWIVERQNLMTSYIYSTAYELGCIRSGLTLFAKEQTFGVQDREQSSQFRGMTKSSKETLS